MVSAGQCTGSGASQPLHQDEIQHGADGARDGSTAPGTLAQRAGVAALAIRALCAELDRASSGIEEGMIDVSAQFRGLAEQAMHQAEELKALATGLETSASGGKTAQAWSDQLMSGLNSMVDSITIVSEQSALVCSVLRDMVGHLRELNGSSGDGAGARWRELAQEIDELAITVSRVGDLIAQRLASIGAVFPELMENETAERPSLTAAHIHRLNEELQRITSNMVSGHKALSDALERSVALSGKVNQCVPQVTKAIQFQDTAKQRLDNVRHALGLVAEHLEAMAQGEVAADGDAAPEIILAEVVNSVTLGDMRARLAGLLLGEAQDPDPGNADDDGGSIELF